ncbi:hypothetical protein EAT51_07820 [Pseudoxanthomonas winnipegensis]|uniref:phage regulatory CII family protein n=1 Tax=Pseudoxanthomonas winnipegensis TaxID=2480810 RepID=UPI00102D91CD|nr:phage regulatory CII family protein [Pseudoxanthomonas winnipegensis]TAA42170.1 hypothetical protein EAT51_07820 [Pseudoxanthomonas winnipegensis]
MNVVDSAHATVHQYPGGSESLAPRLGMSAAVLNSKVNPKTATHHLSLVEAQCIMDLTGDHRILHDLAHALGYVLTPVSDDVRGDETVMELVLDLNAAQGELARELHDALADEVLTLNELNEVAKDCHGSISAILILLRKLRAVARQQAVRHG